MLAVVMIASTAAPAQAQLWPALTDTFDGEVKHATAVRLRDLDRFVKLHNTLQLEYRDWLSDAAKLTGGLQFALSREAESDDDERVTVELRYNF